MNVARAAIAIIGTVCVLALSACGSGGRTGQSPTTQAKPDPTAATTTSTSASPETTTTSGGQGVLSVGGGGVAPPATHSAIPYAHASPTETLDLWLPRAGSEPSPLVVYVHPGGFLVGDSSMVGLKVQPLLDAGYAVASVNYRLAGEALFPAAPQDVKAAVRWLRANATTYDIDPDRFAAWGESVGGNLAALLGTTGDQATVLDDPELGNVDVSSAVQAVVDWFGPTDFLQMDEQLAGPGNSCTEPILHNGATSPESQYIGAPIQTDPTTVGKANPISTIKSARTIPPFLVAHGDADCLVPYQQAEILVSALEDAGVDVSLTILPGAQHGDPQFNEKLLTSTITWLDRTIGPDSR